MCSDRGVLLKGSSTRGNITTEIFMQHDDDLIIGASDEHS